IETVPDARRFMSALRAAARTKPVIVLKSGRHGAAAPPGTPSPDGVFDAALKRAGTVRVATYTQLFGAARILALGRFPSGNRLAVMTNGRGPGLLAAWLGAVDRAEASAALEKGGIANFYTPENAVEAFSFLAAYRKNQKWLLEVPPPQPEFAAVDLATAERIRRRTRRSAGKPLPARQARALLSAFRIKVLPMAASGAPRRARTMTRSIGPAGGTAVAIGVHRDAVFGSVIALGLTKSRDEPDVMLPPLNRRLAADLVASVCGVMPAPERDALIALLLKVSTLVCALPWVIELELGPVLAAAGDAIVVEGRVVIDPKRHVLAHGYRHMAIHPYPVELETTVTLRDGTQLPVRPIRPE